MISKMQLFSAFALNQRITLPNRAGSGFITAIARESGTSSLTDQYNVTLFETESQQKYGVYVKTVD